MGQMFGATEMKDCLMTFSKWTALLVWTVTSALAGAALAQDWPSRPIKIVVPFPAGGNTDAVARITATRLQELLGQNVVVENKAGATRPFQGPDS